MYTSRFCLHLRSSIKQYNLVSAHRRRLSATGKVTAGLALDVLRTSGLRFEFAGVLYRISALQEGSDSDTLIDGYVEMLDRLTTGLRSAHNAYHPVFMEFVLRLRIALIINSRFRHRAKDALPNMNRTQAAVGMHCRK